MTRFYRNQGVGSWEINLAAFLADLNTNQWDPQRLGEEYNYERAMPPPVPPGTANSGYAFADAFSLVAYRYYNYGLLSSPGICLRSKQSISFYQWQRGRLQRRPLQTTYDTNEDFFL